MKAVTDHTYIYVLFFHKYKGLLCDFSFNDYYEEHCHWAPLSSQEHSRRQKQGLKTIKIHLILVPYLSKFSIPIKV